MLHTGISYYVANTADTAQLSSPDPHAHGANEPPYEFEHRYSSEAYPPEKKDSVSQTDDVSVSTALWVIPTANSLLLVPRLISTHQSLQT
jgi:hypothetical protein